MQRRLKKRFLPVADEEFVLKEYGKDEEDDTFYCHCKKVLSYKVPLKGVQAWFGTWRRDITYVFLYLFILLQRLNIDV